MLRKIRVYGRLAQFLGQRDFEADVASAAEAVRFLLANFRHLGLEQHLKLQDYRVEVGGYELSEDELRHPAGTGQAITITPVYAGAGGAVGRIVAGVALVGAAVLAAVGTFGASLAVGGGLFFLTAAAGYIGAALILGGISELLFRPNEEQDPRESFSFSGIQNTVRVGVPVPIVYGEVVVGSVVISSGVDIVPQ